MLCQACQEIFTGRTRPRRRKIGPSLVYDTDWKSHHDTAETLQRSIQSDCFICVSLWEGYSHNDRIRDNDTDTNKRKHKRAMGFVSLYRLQFYKDLTILKFHFNWSEMGHCEFRVLETTGEFGDERRWNYSANRIR
jgi:hypothetical protein